MGAYRGGLDASSADHPPRRSWRLPAADHADRLHALVRRISTQPRLCDYRLSLDARSVTEPGSALHGYGIAPSIKVAADGIPQGEGVQYDRGFQALRYPNYPNDSADNQSGYIDPEHRFLDGVPVPINSRWNHWLIVISGTTATVQLQLDNHRARSLHLAGACTGGIYLRVWNGTAEFRNITISKA